MKTTLPLDQYILSELHKGLRRWDEKTGMEYQQRASQEWNVFRVSQIGECAAAITRDWIGEEGAERDIESLLRLHDGTWTHTALREIFRLSDLELIHEERELGKPYEVVLEGAKTVPVKLLGHQDNSFLYGKEEIVVDFKKASEYSYDKMEQTEEISDAYWDQMQGYLDITGVKRGILFVKGVHGKANAYIIDRDEEYFTGEVLPRLARIALLRKRREIGRREFVQGQFPCTYCRHNELCWTVDVPVEDRTNKIDRKHPQYNNLKSAVELKIRADRAKEESDQLRSDARAAAISIIKKMGTKKVLSVDGMGITWVSSRKKSYSLLDEKKQDAIKKGYVKVNESTVEYPLFSKGK